MFFILDDQTRQQIDSIRKIIETHAIVRDLLTGSDNESNLSKIVASSPQNYDWRLYDHCAVLTRLYGIYENFVEQLISELLRILPSLYRYAELDLAFHTEHRNGTAHVLQRLEMSRYKELSEEKVIRSYLDAISGAKDYHILPETMIRYEQNLRLNILDTLFSRLSITGVHSWLNNHRLMENVLRKMGKREETVESVLATFIEQRNDAAHGKAIVPFETNTLLKYCDLVHALCQALYERVNHWIITRRLQIVTAQEIGIVSEKYRHGVIVAKIHHATVSLGDHFFFLGNLYCYRATIQSIQADDVPKEAITVSDEQEIGFKMSAEGRKKARMIRIDK